MGIPKAWDKDLGKNLFLQGFGDCEIAKRCGVAQGTISYYRKKHWEKDVVEGIPSCDRETGTGLDISDDLAVSVQIPHPEEGIAAADPVTMLPAPVEEAEMPAGNGGENLGGNHMCNCKNKLQDTTALMCSEDYKERFVAEYRQTKIRYEKLKAFNTKIEAARLMRAWKFDAANVEEPKHDCPEDLLREQQHIMGEYLRILELRAVIEGVDLRG